MKIVLESILHCNTQPTTQSYNVFVFHILNFNCHPFVNFIVNTKIQAFIIANNEITKHTIY